MSTTPAPSNPDIPSESAAQELTAVVWDESLLAYKFSEDHPMAPVRLELTHRLLSDLGVLDRPGIRMVAPPVATEEELAAVHDRDYIQAVQDCSSGTLTESPEHGLGTEDDPVFPALHESSARIAGGSALAAELIWRGEVNHAVNFAGGMHHASRSSASGFCIYNDCALAIHRLLSLGAERVAYVDLDAHHGDGVQSIFWDDPRVLTISVHESGMSLFPGTGFASEVGGPDALGSAANVALPAGTGDAGFLRAVHAVVPQLLGAFQPQVLITQHGCDGHHEDPLTNLRLSVDGQRQLTLDAAEWARDFAGDRWLATGGGGYSTTRVVPRAWTHLTAAASGDPLPVRGEVPREWLEFAAGRVGMDVEELPPLLGDDIDVWWRSWEVGYDPADPVDQSIMATRRELFPYHGLDPWFD